MKLTAFAHDSITIVDQCSPVSDPPIIKAERTTAKYPFRQIPNVDGITNPFHPIDQWIIH
jgi:hypothetical protein